MMRREKESVLTYSNLGLHYTLADLMRWILKHSPSLFLHHPQVYFIDSSLIFLNHIWDHWSLVFQGLILDLFSLFILSSMAFHAIYVVMASYSLL